MTKNNNGVNHILILTRGNSLPDYYTRVLVNEGYRVREAADQESALYYAQRWVPQCLMVDLEGCGAEASAFLKKIQKDALFSRTVVILLVNGRDRSQWSVVKSDKNKSANSERDPFGEKNGKGSLPTLGPLSKIVLKSPWQAEFRKADVFQYLEILPRDLPVTTFLSLVAKFLKDRVPATMVFNTNAPSITVYCSAAITSSSKGEFSVISPIRIAVKSKVKVVSNAFEEIGLAHCVFKRTEELPLYMGDKTYRCEVSVIGVKPEAANRLMYLSKEIKS